MVLPGPARLSVVALDWLVTTQGIGELHQVLSPEAVWRPPAETDFLAASARTEIMPLGWFDDGARLDVEVVASLTVLCRADTEYFGWISHEGTIIGVLAAAIGGQALLAVRDGDTVWLHDIGRNSLAEALVGQTADVPAGAGGGVTVVRAELLATHDGQRISEAGVGVRRASADVRYVQRLASSPATGGGELYVAVRDAVGRRRLSGPLHYTDTSHGRFTIVTAPSPEPDQVTVAPATRSDLVTRLRRCHESLAR